MEQKKILRREPKEDIMEQKEFQYKNPLGKPMSKESYENWVLTYDFPEIYNKEGKENPSFIKYNFETLSCTESEGEVYEGMTKDEFFDYEKNQEKSKELLKKFGIDKDLRDLSHNEIRLDDEIIEMHQYADKELLNKVDDDIDNGVYVSRKKNVVCGNTIYISAKVKHIGIEAFAGNNIINAIYVEDNDIKIEEGAFRECYNLTNVHLPEQLKELPKSLFEGDYCLDRLKLPQELEKIGDFAFEGCTGLNFIHIPHGVKEIGNCAFANCNEIIDISFRFNNKLEKIGNYAFANAGSESQPLVIDFPDTLREIGECAFENANISYMSMTENTVKSIDIDKAFEGWMDKESIKKIKKIIGELGKPDVIPGIGKYFAIEGDDPEVELRIVDFEKFKESIINLNDNKLEDIILKKLLNYYYIEAVDFDIDIVKQIIKNSKTEEDFVKQIKEL